MTSSPMTCHFKTLGVSFPSITDLANDLARIEKGDSPIFFTHSLASSWKAYACQRDDYSALVDKAKRVITQFDSEAEKYSYLQLSNKISQNFKEFAAAKCGKDIERLYTERVRLLDVHKILFANMLKGVDTKERLSYKELRALEQPHPLGGFVTELLDLAKKGGHILPDQLQRDIDFFQTIEKIQLIFCKKTQEFSADTLQSSDIFLVDANKKSSYAGKAPISLRTLIQELGSLTLQVTQGTVGIKNTICRLQPLITGTITHASILSRYQKAKEHHPLCSSEILEKYSLSPPTLSELCWTRVVRIEGAKLLSSNGIKALQAKYPELSLEAKYAYVSARFQIIVDEVVTNAQEGLETTANSFSRKIKSLLPIKHRSPVSRLLGRTITMKGDMTCSEFVARVVVESLRKFERILQRELVSESDREESVTLLQTPFPDTVYLSQINPSRLYQFLLPFTSQIKTHSLLKAYLNPDDLPLWDSSL